MKPILPQGTAVRLNSLSERYNKLTTLFPTTINAVGYIVRHYTYGLNEVDYYVSFNNSLLLILNEEEIVTLPNLKRDTPFELVIIDLIDYKNIALVDNSHNRVICHFVNNHEDKDYALQCATRICNLLNEQTNNEDADKLSKT